MPITEVIFHAYKTDPQTLAGLGNSHGHLVTAFSGVDGLKTLFRGPLLEQDGEAIGPQSGRDVLAIEWEKEEFFHQFFPGSEKFKALYTKMKDFAAAPARPELYEATNRSTLCFSSEVTQIIKVRSGTGTEAAWKRLEEVLSASPAGKPALYHANGIGKEEGGFIGLIGWQNLEHYQTVGKQNSILELIEHLNKNEKVQSSIAKLQQVDLA
ncbi:hypothetical protein BKA67DRAFT_659769 [Truncatella angustata]|uniref:Uncharacterized protein n=1 Tax=Truncatella angustata TaxID=152316 RepID=A0A9P8UJ38_9PEZI|nr:uncharacterized protein BKA67DRAFT_659769 [Truncatella angustata]KAH6653127.1 hypothetical protein BKA67DRAFT_659769 [Truncatella angustata]KAH8199358.1 hypothetical protein TruAng_006490 [Truncatella angustata]